MSKQAYTEPRQPLFTTEDGKPAHEYDEFAIVELPSYLISRSVCINHAGVGGHANQKYFSSEAAANEYILMNKPCLSVTDFDGWCDRWFIDSPAKEAFIEGVKRIAKSKLNTKS